MSTEFRSPIETLGSDALRDAVMSRAKALGCEHAQLRIGHIRNQALFVRDGALETSNDSTQIGLGLRVVIDGAAGFAGTVALDPAAAAQLVDQAVDAARTTRIAQDHPTVLADEVVHRDIVWSSNYRIDPATVSAAEKAALLTEWCARLARQPGVDHVSAQVLACVEDTFYADLTGTSALQRRVRVHPSATAMTVTDSGFESMRTLAPPAARGWEYLHGEGWDFEAELASIPEHLAAKRAAPSVQADDYDVVIDATNLFLTIHESIGHATELDRALGYEAGLAGTSFATFDQLGSLKYGSEVMNVTGDRVDPYGLATVAIDDEGVGTQRFDIVRDGILVGYQLDRAMAFDNALGRSNGCAFADSPLRVPIQRMANVSLQPAPGNGPTVDELIAGVDRGIYIVGDKSWSIDMQRHNFQFTGQRFFRIDKGRLAGQVKDVAYQSNTTDFWGSLEAVGGESTYLLSGAFNCGKGQPMQTAPVGHGCPAALFRSVKILNALSESGR